CRRCAARHGARTPPDRRPRRCCGCPCGHPAEARPRSCRVPPAGKGGGAVPVMHVAWLRARRPEMLGRNGIELPNDVGTFLIMIYENCFQMRFLEKKIR